MHDRLPSPDRPDRADAWRWMQRLTQVLSLVAFAITVFMGVPARGDDGRPAREARHSAAMAAYQAGRWSEAYDGLARLADDGDAEAARLAVLMVRHGPVLFGQRFEAREEQRDAWVRLSGATSLRSANAVKVATGT